jgi:hypothetical protein
MSRPKSLFFKKCGMMYFNSLFTVSLASTDFHFFALLKESMGNQKFAFNEQF